jgi:hypothetical protein
VLFVLTTGLTVKDDRLHVVIVAGFALRMLDDDTQRPVTSPGNVVVVLTNDRHLEVWHAV